MSIHDQISAYFDDSYTAEEMLKLEEELRSNPESLADFALASVIEKGLGDALATEDVKSLTGELMLEDEQQVVPNTSNVIQKNAGSWKSFSIWKLSLAAGVVFALALGIMLTNDSAEPTVATLLRQHNAQWQAGSIKDGAKLSQGTRQLTEGYAEIALRTGARVRLEAPCEIALTSGNFIHLNSGRLTADVSPQAEGFQVRTPLGTLIDKGTVFGVDMNPEAGLSSIVLSGKVLLTSPEYLEQDKVTVVALTTGQIGGISKDGQMRPARIATDKDRKVYVSSWSEVAYEPQFEGNIDYRRITPPSVKRGELRSKRIQVFLERKNLRLRQPLNPDIAHPGRYPQSPAHEAQGDIPANKLVDVYLVHFDPGGKKSHSETVMIDFGRPVLGINWGLKSLNMSDEVLGAPGSEYDKSHRSCEVDTNFTGSDSCELSEDRNRLNISMSAGSSADQMRVLVEALK